MRGILSLLQQGGFSLGESSFFFLFEGPKVDFFKGTENNTVLASFNKVMKNSIT
jgi:hypothetical protein